MNHALNLRQPTLSLRQPLAHNASANPLDVLMMKSALGVLGHYEAPEWGVTQFPDAALYTAITDFQKSAGLKVDGVMKPDGPTEDTLHTTLTNHQSATALHITARSLQDLGRNGDEILAHITPAEAQLLHRVTDGASINPKTGLLEFWYDYEADAAGVGDTASNTGPDRDYDRDNDNGPTTKKNDQGTPTSAQPTATSALTATPTTVPDQTKRRSPLPLAGFDPSLAKGFFEIKDEKQTVFLEDAIDFLDKAQRTATEYAKAMAADLEDRATNPKRNMMFDPSATTMPKAEQKKMAKEISIITGLELAGGGLKIGGSLLGNPLARKATGRISGRILDEAKKKKKEWKYLP